MNESEPIDCRVGGDRGARGEGEPDGAAVLPAGRLQRPPWPGDDKNSCDEAAHADRGLEAQRLAEDEDPDRDCQERRRPAGDRIYERQAAARVGRREAQEVDRLEDPRAECQGDPGRLQFDFVVSPGAAVATDPCGDLVLTLDA